MISKWDFILGVCILVMYGFLVYLLWDIHTILALNADAVQAIMRSIARIQ